MSTCTDPGKGRGSSRGMNLVVVNWLGRWDDCEMGEIMGFGESSSEMEFVVKRMGNLVLGDEKDGRGGLVEASSLVSRISISSISVCWVAKDFFNDSKS